MSVCEKMQLHHAGDELLKLDGINGEVANAFGQLLGGHGVLIHHPSENLFVHLNAGEVGARGGSRIKHPAKAVTTRKHAKISLVDELGGEIVVSRNT